MFKVDVVWCVYCKLRTVFAHCFGVWIVNFEQANAGWEIAGLQCVRLLSTESMVIVLLGNKFTIINSFMMEAVII